MLPAIPIIFAIALFMEKVDSNIITTSLPAIAADLGTSPLSLKLALTSYLVSLSIFIPISGWFADRFTARRIFASAIVVFILGSILCALSNNLTTFVFARLLQGVGGAMMSPVGRILLIRNTQKNQLVSAMAWVTVPALIGPLIGPLIGGAITNFISWHWIFIINIPIGIVCLFVAILFMPKNEEPIIHSLDYIGFILSSLALSGILFGSSILGIPSIPLSLSLPIFAIGIISAFLYLYHAQRISDPLLNFRLFKDKTFRISIVAASIFRIGVGAMPFLLPLMFQLCFGLSPIQAGLLVAASALGALLTKTMATFIFAHISFRNVLLFGAASSSIFSFWYGFFTPHYSMHIIIFALFCGGLIRSICFTAVNTLAYENIPDTQTSQATTIANVFQQASLATGVALAGIFLEISSFAHQPDLTLTDFKIAFIGVALISFFSFFIFLNLSKKAGKTLI